MSALLAVDLGLATGLAWFDRSGRLLGYRSTSFPDRARLRLAVHAVVAEHAEGLLHLVAEGDDRHAAPWAREAARLGVAFELIGAEAWRRALLLPRERRDRRAAKRAADRIAREVIAADGCRRPTSLRHDAAEAICVGRWAVERLGWR